MADQWETLERECGQCRGCSLWETRKHLVFDAGSRTAEVMLVGEGPGASEDEQGIPFVGRAGQFLDDMLEIIGLDRTRVYISNIVKCRPPGNRDPLTVMQASCCVPRSSSVWAASQPCRSSSRTSRSPASMVYGLSGAAFG